MPIDIYFLSNVILWITNLLTLVIACLYCYRVDRPDYLRIFPIYLFVSIAIEFFANSFIRKWFPFPFLDHQPALAHALYNLFTPFETFVFAYFLYQIIQSNLIRKWAIALLSLFSIYFIGFCLVKGVGTFSFLAVLLESFICIILCLAFYRQLFTRTESIDLLKEHSFWLVTGIFFYLATIFPLFMAASYLKTHGLVKVAKGLYCINNFALAITYFLFIKGFTCRIKK